MMAYYFQPDKADFQTVLENSSCQQMQGICCLTHIYTCTCPHTHTMLSAECGVESSRMSLYDITKWGLPWRCDWAPIPGCVHSVFFLRRVFWGIHPILSSKSGSSRVSAISSSSSNSSENEGLRKDSICQSSHSISQSSKQAANQY